MVEMAGLFEKARTSAAEPHDIVVGGHRLRQRENAGMISHIDAMRCVGRKLKYRAMKPAWYFAARRRVAASEREA